MIKNTILTCFILSMPFTVKAGINIDNMNLAKQCHQLSLKLKETGHAETNPFCSDKISSASTWTEMAGESVTEDNNYLAKYELKSAIKDLNYSMVEDCSTKAKIAEYKNELQILVLQIQ